MFESISYFAPFDTCMELRSATGGPIDGNVSALRYFVKSDENWPSLLDHVEYTIARAPIVFKAAGKNGIVDAHHLAALQEGTCKCVDRVMDIVAALKETSLFVVHEGDNREKSAPFSEALALLARRCCEQGIQLTVLIVKAHSDNGFSPAFYEGWKKMLDELPYTKGHKNAPRVYFAVTAREAGGDRKATMTFEMATHTCFIGSEWYKLRPDGETYTTGYKQLLEHRDGGAHAEEELAPGVQLFTRLGNAVPSESKGSSSPLPKHARAA